MGTGERARDARYRIAGRICCWCKKMMPDNGWRGGERACEKCEAEKLAAHPPRRVYLSFTKREEWTVQMMSDDLRGSVGRLRGFATHDKILEMIARTTTKLDLAARCSLEDGIKNGKGGLYLEVTEAQYQAWRMESDLTTLT